MQNHIKKEFIRYVSQSILAMIGLSCYILADTFFVSWGLGENGLAALNIACPVFNIVFATGLMLGVGGGARYAMAKGAGDKALCDEIFSHSARSMLVAALFFLSLGIFFSEPIARFLGAEGDILPLCKTYVQVILCFAPFFLCNNMCQNFVRNDGQPRLAMIAMLSGNLFNIVFDYVLVFPCGLGMLGAALATGFSPIVSVAILSRYVLGKQKGFHFIPCSFRPRLLSRIAATGFPSFLGEFSNGLVMLTFNQLLLKMGGNTAVAAYTVIVNVNFVVIAIFNGVGQGCQPLVSLSYGEGNREKIRTLLRYGFFTVGTLALCLYGLLFFGADMVAGIFNREGVAALQSLASQGIRLYFLAVLFSGFNLFFVNYFAASNQAVFAQIVAGLRGYVLIFPFAFFFAHTWQITGLWLATPVAEALTLVAALCFYFRARNRAITPIQ